MKNGIKVLEIAGALIGFVILLSTAFYLLNKGQDTFSSSNAELTNTLSSVSSGQYDAYDGTSDSGEGVRRMINDLFTNEDIEVLVCCKDGSDYVYNAVNVGKSTATVLSLNSLTGMPTYDAAGKAFSTEDASGSGVATIAGAPSALMCSTGYDDGASVNTTGYISETAIFVCSVQKDINGNVRRLTYVQK